MNTKQAYIFIAFTLHQGYVGFRTDTNAYGTSPTTQCNKTPHEVINELLESFGKYYELVEHEIR